MKYNLSRFSQTISNTSEGSIELTTDEVISIVNTTAANIAIPTASGTVSGTLVLDCDLGTRVHVDEVQYRFSSSAPVSTVSSGIKFFYKNESFDIYMSLNTYYNGNYFYTLVSGTEAPRYIRVEHTVISGAEGNIHGFAVLNDDTYVDFGEDGTKTNHNVSLSLENAIIEINTMFVHNSGPVKANAKLIIEPQRTVADDILSISSNASGPWYGVYRDEDMVTGPGLWDTGNMDNVEVLSNVLKLEGGEEVGTYTTRIITLDDNQRLTFNVMDYYYPVLVPEVEFFDDFSTGDTYWDVTYTYTWTPDAGYCHSFSNEISFSRYYHALGGNNVIFFTTKSLEYDYGEDWQLSFDFLYYYHKSDAAGMYVYPLYPQTNFYFRVYTDNDPSGDAWIVVNGISYSLSAAADWAADVNTWFSIKIQRNFTIINLKVWKRSDPEPGAWSWTGSINLNDLPIEGGIRITDQHLLDTDCVEDSKLDNFILIKNYSASATAKSIIATEDTDTLENIEVRSSNSAPMDRLSYIELTGVYAASALGTTFTQHRWMADGSIAETSEDYGNWGRSGNYWEVWYDSVREDEYIVDKPFYTGSYGDTYIYFRIRRKNGTVTSKTISTGDYDYDCYYNTYKLTPDQSGGFWIYFYLSRSGSGGGNYYFRYYNSSFVQQYNRQATAAQGTFLYDFDAVYYSNGYLWYTDRELSTVFKLDSGGTVLASYLATEDIRGLFSLPDGGCWFIQEGALIRIDADANFVESIEIPTTTASYVYSDMADGFWLHDGYVIRHLRSDGTEYFNIEIPNLYLFTVSDSGVLTKHHDGSTNSPPKASFVSKEHKRITRTWDYPVNEGGWKGTFDYNRYGVRSHKYDDLTSDHASHFPIPIDNQWNISSEWGPASLRDYNFTSDQYHQMRFTLRADTSINSPDVYGLYTQRAIEVPDIYPGNYGRYYLKSDISYLNPGDIGDYTSKIRAFWYLNTE